MFGLECTAHDESGACTAISTVFRITGIPAFVILPEAELAATSSL